MLVQASLQFSYVSAKLGARSDVKLARDFYLTCEVLLMPTMISFPSFNPARMCECAFVIETH